MSAVRQVVVQRVVPWALWQLSLAVAQSEGSRPLEMRWPASTPMTAPKIAPLVSLSETANIDIPVAKPTVVHSVAKVRRLGASQCLSRRVRNASTKPSKSMATASPSFVDSLTTP